LAVDDTCISRLLRELGRSANDEVALSLASVVELARECKRV
jgi:hypothetical protein